MRLRSHALLGLCLATAVGCTREDSTALVLRIDADLEIPRETNSLAVRLQNNEGEVLEERIYALGTAPRHVWPQTLPIVAGSRPPNRLNIAVELRYATPGAPSAVVGFAETEADFPSSGQRQLALQVMRACVDEDGDGYGVGFGCILPDCDDTRRDVPAEVFCPGPPEPDAGMRDDAGIPQDAEVDPGPDDAGVPQDAEVVDVGPAPDAMVPDAGEVMDTGVPPDAGTLICGGEACAPDDVCFMDQCLEPCNDNFDCDTVSEACLTNIGVCICRVPCQNEPTSCGPFQCIDGCCQF